MLDLRALEATAEQRLGAGAFAFAASGAGDERTVRGNEQAWESMWLQPRVLRDVGTVTTTTTVLGRPVAAPVLVAPTAMHRMFHPDGEAAVAQAAATAGTVMVVAMAASTAVEDIAAAAPGARLWMHVTLARDRKVSEELCKCAAAAGCEAIVLTVDCPVPVRRPRSDRAGFELPPGVGLPNLLPRGAGSADAAALHAAVGEFARSVTFDDISRVAEWSNGLPVVVKGLSHPDDADKCVSAGAAAVVVSNHGGRQLDPCVPTAWALPRVAEAVAGRAEVYVDGGIRRGAHVLAAVANGADAVLVGRPVIYGLAVGGSDGVAEVLHGLRTDLETAMALCGVTDVPSITPDLVWRHA